MVRAVSFDVVVAADLDWGIGRSNALPWPKLKGDLAHFRRVTSACTEGRTNAIIMGRKTWESAEVAGKPLPRRLNVVVTRQRGLAVPEGVIVAASLDAALTAARAPNVENIFLVGGAELYREGLAHADLRWVYLTRVEGHLQCDAHIPSLDALGFVKDGWEGEQDGEDAGIRYHIARYTRPTA
jgi:dihydrofolate reductase